MKAFRFLLVAVALGLIVPELALAGPLDDAIKTTFKVEIGWWAELVAVISAVLGLVLAIFGDRKLPTGVSTVLNVLANNWGKARNAP